ncbi:hypothetical protein M413DRAFT_10416 [Hebeloma cylindrosporum]|uniref:Uncharacterized protein n=1 Tax=Hebeloma cylindrosporum TaxID=76867 RepID=A0A0C2XX38_HEBCY|nr:hypothetical protein M413DRAFT_10416 [Hebeloma cylindrosporum h7]
MPIHEVLVPRQGTLSSSSATPSSSTITLPPFLYFQPIPQAITCQPLELSWFYNGPDSVFTFYVTNVGVPQSSIPPPLSSSSSSFPRPSNTFTNARRAVPKGANPEPITTTVVLAANVPGTRLDLTWSAVTVPQGWYVINATMPSSQYTVLTSAFYVYTGADTSCLLDATASSTSRSPGSTGFPVPTGGSSTGGAGTGTIIGATIGSVAFLVQGGAGGSGGDFRKSLAHRWNGLSSTDAALTGGGMGKSHSSYRHQAHRVDSMGTIQTPSEEAAEKYSTTGKFDDDTNSNGHGGVALAYLPVLAHNGAKPSALGRTYSTSSSVSAHGGFKEPQNDVYASASTTLRRGSIADSAHGRKSVDSTTYPPISPVRHSTLPRTQSFPTNPHHKTSTVPTSHSSNVGYPSPISPQDDNNNNNNNNNNNYPTSPIDAATKQANRQSLGRKRKPVPAYNPNDHDPSSPVSPPPPHSPPLQVPPPPVPTPSPYHSTNPSPSPEPSTLGYSSSGTGGSNGIGNFGNANANGHGNGNANGNGIGIGNGIGNGNGNGHGNGNGNGGAHYATRSQLGQDHSVPDLAHKSSFGPGGVEGKPLHYLIPDMPVASLRR